MILALGILFVVCGIGAWLYSMYLSWKASTDSPFDPVAAGPLLARVDKVVRLTRRSWYQLQTTLTRALIWLGHKAKAQLITWFPSSAAAFERHDKLAGLSHGPSSYFLKRISPTPTQTPSKRLPRTKKML